MNKKHITKIYVAVIFAAILWFIIFVVKPFNFWLSMSCGVLLLILMATLFDRQLIKAGKFKPRHIIIGILSAVVLYLVFYVGNYLSAFLIPLKDAQITSVYMNRNGTSVYVIGVALMLIIGPGEEIFWRGFVQKTLSKDLGTKSIVITALLYTSIHVVALNFMLIMAALVCGLFWGALYYREKSMYPVIISHAIWDVSVFLLFPYK